jgi:hypothetical protein
VAFGGITPPAPRAPYAMFGGHTSLALPPGFIFCTPSVQHGITPESGNSIGSPRL